MFADRTVNSAMACDNHMIYPLEDSLAKAFVIHSMELTAIRLQVDYLPTGINLQLHTYPQGHCVMFRIYIFSRLRARLR